MCESPLAAGMIGGVQFGESGVRVWYLTHYRGAYDCRGYRGADQWWTVRFSRLPERRWLTTQPTLRRRSSRCSRGSRRTR